MHLLTGATSLLRHQRHSLLLILLFTLSFLDSPTASQAGVIVSSGNQYLEISGIYEFNFGHGRRIIYHDLLQASSTETLTNSISDHSFDVYAQITGGTAETQTIVPNGASPSSIMLNTQAAGTSQTLAASWVQTYNFGRDYVSFTLDAPHAFKLSVDLSGTSTQKGGNATAASEAYLQLAGASGYVVYVYAESDDGGAPASASQTFEGVLDPGSYTLSNYSFASGYGPAPFSSSPSASGSVLLSFPAVPEPASITLWSLGGAAALIGLWCRRRNRYRTNP